MSSVEKAKAAVRDAYERLTPPGLARDIAVAVGVTSMDRAETRGVDMVLAAATIRSGCVDIDFIETHNAITETLIRYGINDA